MLDRVERLPIVVPLALSASSVLVPIAVVLLVGGTPGVVALAVGAAVLALSAGLLAWRLHLGRLPLVLAPLAVRSKLDGHSTFRFRALLGRGRAMQRAKARVRFVPDRGEPVELEPIMPEADRLLGPWTVVVVDRANVCEQRGKFEIHVTAEESKGTRWEVQDAYTPERVVAGRFAPGIVLRKGRTDFDLNAWTQVIEDPTTAMVG